MNEKPKHLDKQCFLDPVFHQYIKDCICCAPEARYNRLDDREKRTIRELATASLEDKLYLLGVLGYRFAIVVVSRDKISSKPINWPAVVKWFKNRILKMVGSGLRDMGFFALADPAFMRAITRFSIDISATTMYMIRNQEEIQKNIERTKDIKARRGLEDAFTLHIDDLISKAYKRVFFWDKTDVERYKISKQHIPYLFYMSVRRDRMCSITELAGCVHLSSYNMVSIHLKELLQAEIISEDTENYIQLYQLTGYGIFVLNAIRHGITREY